MRPSQRDQFFDELCSRYPEFRGTKAAFNKLILVDGQTPENILREVEAVRGSRLSPKVEPVVRGKRREIVDPDAWLQAQEDDLKEINRRFRPFKG